MSHTGNPVKGLRAGRRNTRVFLKRRRRQHKYDRHNSIVRQP